MCFDFYYPVACSFLRKRREGVRQIKGSDTRQSAPTRKEEKAMINLLYCGNKRVFDGLLISLLSIARKTDRQLNVYVFTVDLRNLDPKFSPITVEQTTFLEKMIKKYNSDSSITLLDITGLFMSEMGNSKNIFGFYTPYTLLRLFCDKVPELPDKLLYMDADTVAMKDIGELFDIDVEGYEFAASIDYIGKFFLGPRYLNAGVMLINIPESKKTGVFEKARVLCTVKKLYFPDQDALNRKAKKKKRIKSIYNSQRWLREKDVVRHFCRSLRLLPYPHLVNIKPWDEKGLHEVLHVHYIDDLLEEYKVLKKEFLMLYPEK